MKEPPIAIQGLLHSIESAVLQVYASHTRMADKDVEFVYDLLYKYFQAEARGQEPADPVSSSEMRMALIDAIFDNLEVREDMNADAGLVNSDFQPAGRPLPTFDAVYAYALNILRPSVRFWRKKDGRTGYLRYISKYVL